MNKNSFPAFYLKKTARNIKLGFAFVSLMALSAFCCADELSVNFGIGDQFQSSQENRGGGVDFEFYRFARSHRQFFSIGAGYTYIRTNEATDKTIHAFSLYPQVTLQFNERNGWRPYFFVRALGPTYISNKQLGEREQGEHFVFQAQVGAGILLPAKDVFLAVSYKHFSNAELFSPNDGIDLPLVLTIGRRF